MSGESERIPFLKQVVRQWLGDKKKLSELADALDFTPSVLSNILAGKRGTDDVIVAIAEKLEAPVANLLLAALADRCHNQRNASDDFDTRRRWEKAGGEYQRLMSELSPSARERTESREPRSFISLEDFPNILGGQWQVITGD